MLVGDSLHRLALVGIRFEPRLRCEHDAEAGFVAAIPRVALRTVAGAADPSRVVPTAAPVATARALSLPPNESIHAHSQFQSIVPGDGR